jgi:hypothetical protein
VVYSAGAPTLRHQYWPRRAPDQVTSSKKSTKQRKELLMTENAKGNPETKLENKPLDHYTSEENQELEEIDAEQLSKIVGGGVTLSW